MTKVTIEQKHETAQTYFRLQGVAHYLKKPYFKIRRLASNETLGQDGWKNETVSHEAGQALDGGDLLLQIDPRLVNYIETGRAIEVSIEELGVAERILPPNLFPFPASRAAGPSPGKIIFRKVDPLPDTDHGGGTPPPHRPPQPDDGADRTVPATDGETEPYGGEGGRGDDEQGAGDGDTPKGDDDKTVPVEPIPGEDSTADDTDHETTGDDSLPEKPKRVVVAVALATVVGLSVGFLSKYIYDEYYIGGISAPSAGVSNRALSLIQNDAFAPLSADLRVVPARSPLGKTPEQVSGRTNPNRSRAFYDAGAQAAQAHNKEEAAYWYKQSISTTDPDALTFLGDAYMNGDGVPPDPRTGFQLIRLGAALGSENAKSYIADLLEHGRIDYAPPAIGNAYRSR